MPINNYDDCIYPIHDVLTEGQIEVRDSNLSYGQMLKKKVEEKGWTSDRFAKKLGQAKGTVVNYYRNFNVPTQKTREIIEVLLGISVALQEEYILKTKWTYQLVYRQSDGTLKVSSTPEVKARQLENTRRAQEKKKQNPPKLLPLAKKIQEEVQKERSESPKQKVSNPLTSLLTQAEKGTVYLYHNNDLYSLSKV